MTSHLRPDERAEAARARKPQMIKNALDIGVKGAAGAAVASKVVPWLSELIPTDLAIKGINKVYPKLGEFLKKGQESGLDIKEGIDFIRSKSVDKEPPKQNKNIIEQYSPELHQFIQQQIQNGQSPLAAGALAELEGKGTKGFKKVIQQIIKDHKAPWSAILQSVYGEPGKGQKSQPEAVAVKDMLAQQGQQQPAQQQQGGVPPELQSLLQQGNAILSKFRGPRG